MSSYLTEIPQLQLNTTSNQLRFGASNGVVSTMSFAVPASHNKCRCAKANSNLMLSTRGAIT